MDGLHVKLGVKSFLLGFVTAKVFRVGRDLRVVGVGLLVCHGKTVAYGKPLELLCYSSIRNGLWAVIRGLQIPVSVTVGFFRPLWGKSDIAER